MRLALQSTGAGRALVLIDRPPFIGADKLVAKAQAFTGVKEKSALIRRALKVLIERASAIALLASAK